MDEIQATFVIEYFLKGQSSYWLTLTLSLAQRYFIPTFRFSFDPKPTRLSIMRNNYSLVRWTVLHLLCWCYITRKTNRQNCARYDEWNKRIFKLYLSSYRKKKDI